MSAREESYVRGILKCLRDYDDWLSKSDICLLIDQTGNASYIWGVIDALIATNHITQGLDLADNRYRLCRITSIGIQWLQANEIPF